MSVPPLRDDENRTREVPAVSRSGSGVSDTLSRASGSGESGASGLSPLSQAATVKDRARTAVLRVRWIGWWARMVSSWDGGPDQVIHRRRPRCHRRRGDNLGPGITQESWRSHWAIT